MNVRAVEGYVVSDEEEESEDGTLPYAPCPAQVVADYNAAYYGFIATPGNLNPNCLHGAPSDDESIIEPISGDPLCVVRRRTVKEFMDLSDKLLTGEQGMNIFIGMTSLMEGLAPTNIIDVLLVKAMFAEAVNFTLQGKIHERSCALMVALFLKYFVQVGPEEWREAHTIIKAKEAREFPWVAEMYKRMDKIHNGHESIGLLYKEIPCECLSKLKRNIRAKPKPVRCGNSKCNKIDVEAGMRACTGCNRIAYCNEQCQLAHWGAHKFHCKIYKYTKRAEEEM